MVLEKTLESPLDSKEIKPVNPAAAAAAAKLLQSCPTLSDPMDSSPPGSSVHRILQARILEWVAFSFSASQWTEEHGRLQSMGLQKELGTTWSLNNNNRATGSTR